LGKLRAFIFTLTEKRNHKKFTTENEKNCIKIAEIEKTSG